MSQKITKQQLQNEIINLQHDNFLLLQFITQFIETTQDVNKFEPSLKHNFENITKLSYGIPFTENIE